jgi:hypothetical protein
MEFGADTVLYFALHDFKQPYQANYQGSVLCFETDDRKVLLQKIDILML